MPLFDILTLKTNLFATPKVAPALQDWPSAVRSPRAISLSDWGSRRVLPRCARPHRTSAPCSPARSGG